MRLAEQVVLVTGGGRGIGRAIALGCAREGAHVAIVYLRDMPAAERTAAEIRGLGRRASLHQADVGADGAAARVVAEVVAAHGRLDALVNNAGIVARAPLLDLPVEEFDRVIATNLRGPFLMMQAAARQMIAQGSGGRIVNITSEVSRRSLPTLAIYAASKAALAHLTRNAAVELAPHGIIVNAVAPGTTLTEMNRARLSDPAYVAKRLERVPLGRVASPEEMVGPVLLCLSDEGRFMAGAEIAVDGGSTVS